jgi:hypothetical protein
VTDALLSVVAAVAFAAVVVAVLCLLTLAPFVLAVGLAERHGLGTARCGLAAAACSAVGLAVAGLALRHGLGLVPLVLGVAATWAAPVALVALGSAGGRLTGVRGRHE